MGCINIIMVAVPWCLLPAEYGMDIHVAWRKCEEGKKGHACDVVKYHSNLNQVD